MKLNDLISTPIYSVNLPSTNKKVKFRPFLVKEERALLAAHESEDIDVMLNTLMTVVYACMVDKTIKITPYDLEYLFLHIRSKSVGEKSSLIFTCESCSKESPIEIDIREAKVETPSKESFLIKLTEDLAVVMRHPTIDQVMELKNNLTSGSSQELKDELIASCFSKIIKGEETIDVSEEPVESILQFINSLQGKQFEKLSQFIEAMPTVSHEFTWKCAHCSADNKTLIKGLNDFF